ncbi:hypothetical protein LXL04_034958 [Taraxacum kok-saghyz]
MWNLRISNNTFNLIVVYDGHPTLFTIKLYHRGEFTNFRDRKYTKGNVNYVDMMDIDEFSIHELNAIMGGLSGFSAIVSISPEYYKEKVLSSYKVKQMGTSVAEQIDPVTEPIEEYINQQVEEQAVEEQEVKDQEVEEQAVEEQEVNDQEVEEHALKEHEVEEQNDLVNFYFVVITLV